MQTTKMADWSNTHTCREHVSPGIPNKHKHPLPQTHDSEWPGNDSDYLGAWEYRPTLGFWTYTAALWGS